MENHFFKKKKKYILLADIVKICNFDAKFFLKNQKIYNVGNLREAKSNEITFFDNLNYEKDAISCKAFACITNERLVKFLNKKVMPIISKKPLLDFYKVVKIFYPESSVDNENIVSFKISKKFSKKNISIGSNCLIDQTVQIGSNTKIGNNVFIKPKVSIGRNCIIGSNVIIENSFLGDNVIIKSGTLIGQTGFGFYIENNKRIKFPHIGRVIIESSVIIGSLCTIDRGSLTDTIIGEFSSIDNQVQVAHNVKIGHHCMIASQVGIAGSTIIGNKVQIGGQAGISGHLKIGNNVKIGGKSGVVKDIEDNQTVMGYPATNIKSFLKNNK